MMKRIMRRRKKGMTMKSLAPIAMTTMNLQRSALNGLPLPLMRMMTTKSMLKMIPITMGRTNYMNDLAALMVADLL
jgi:hypothetical protein